MRRAVRAIVLREDKLLVMHRDKFGTEYDTLPGGAIGMGEAPEQALMRELTEETSVAVSNPRLVFVEHAGDPFGDQYIYICDYVSGEPQLNPDSEEHKINQLGNNLYNPIWALVSELATKPFMSEKLKANIINCLEHGWPESPVEFS
ncbi:MAG: NUDIX domain-containing protein [Candidatus Saccharimonadales bacterium]